MGEVSTGTYVPPSQVRMQTASPVPQPPEHHAPTNPSIEERAAARTSFDTPAQPASPMSQMISDAERALRRAHTSLSADNGNLRELNRQKEESGLLSWAFGTSAAIDREIRMTEEQRVRNETTATRLEIFHEGLKSAEGLLSKEELSQQDRLELARIIVEQEDLKGQINGISRGNSQQRATELAQQDPQTLMSRFEEVAVYNAQALNIGNPQHYREALNNQRQGLRDIRADYDAAGNRIEVAEKGTRIVRDASLVAGTTVAGVAAAPVVVAGAAAVGVTGTAAVAGTTVVGVTATGTAAGLTLATAENIATGLSDAAFNGKSTAQIIEERMDQMKSDTSLVFSTAAATGVAVATGGAGNAMLGTRASSAAARVGMGAVSGAAAGETGYLVNTGISYAGAVRDFNEQTKGQELSAEQSSQAWSEFCAQRGLDAESIAWGALKSAGLGAVGGTIGYGGASVRAGLDSTAAKAASVVAEEVLTTGACLAPAAYLYSQGKITGEELVQMGFQDFVTGIVSNVAGEAAHAAINTNHSRPTTAGASTESQAATGVAAAAPMAAKVVADAVNPVRTTDAQSKPATPQDTPIRTNEPQSAVRTDPSQRPIPAGSTTAVPEGRISQLRGMLKGIAGEIGETMSVETMKQADMDRHLGAEGRDVMNNGRRVIISEERYAQLQARPADSDGADPLTNILAHEAAAIYCREKGIPANDIPMLLEGIDPNNPGSVRDFNDRMARHEGQEVDRSISGRQLAEEMTNADRYSIRNLDGIIPKSMEARYITPGKGAAEQAKQFIRESIEGLKTLHSKTTDPDVRGILERDYHRLNNILDNDAASRTIGILCRDFDIELGIAINAHSNVKLYSLDPNYKIDEFFNQVQLLHDGANEQIRINGNIQKTLNRLAAIDIKPESREAQVRGEIREISVNRTIYDNFAEPSHHTNMALSVEVTHKSDGTTASEFDFALTNPETGHKYIGETKSRPNFEKMQEQFLGKQRAIFENPENYTFKYADGTDCTTEFVDCIRSGNFDVIMAWGANKHHAKAFPELIPNDFCFQHLENVRVICPTDSELSKPGTGWLNPTANK